MLDFVRQRRSTSRGRWLIELIRWGKNDR